MNIFTKKSIIQKIAMLCLFLALFNFFASTPVYADNSAGFGGKLMEPIMTLIVRLGDGIQDILHEALVSQSGALIEVSTKTTAWEVIVKILIAIAAIAVAVGVVLLVTWGGAAIAAWRCSSVFGSNKRSWSSINRDMFYCCIGIWYSCSCMGRFLGCMG